MKMIPRTERIAPAPGIRYGRLSVVARHDRRRWLVRCDCGATKLVDAQALRSGRTVTCAGGSCRTTHGHASGGELSPTYQSWSSMIARCTRPTNKDWHLYGGRGIAVCDRWRYSFAAFLEDMGERPPGTSIDRRDGNRGYEPGNCRWADALTQGRNKATTVLTPDLVHEIHGRCEHGQTQAAVARTMGISSRLVQQVRSGGSWREHLRGWPS